jgi:phosphoribosyl 1,2-cyclic phosphodiesterase
MGGAAVNITFFGVRGSTPCPCEENRRYGGNTACVALEVPGEDPIIFDLGTGLRFFGETQPQDGTFRGTALVTHLHWDHVQGLPFFVPVLQEGARLDVYAPVQDGVSLRGAFDEFMRPPFFPVSVEDLPGEIVFHDTSDDDLAIGDAKVRSRQVPHVGRTLGYRVDWHGVSVAYISDHQQPDDPDHVDDGVIELCDGADLVIHDAQYTPEEFAQKATWGHCTVSYAVEVARRAGARRLALFHHDPAHCDSVVDDLLHQAQDLGAAAGLDEVIAAAEGLTVSYTGAGSPS